MATWRDRLRALGDTYIPYVKQVAAFVCENAGIPGGGIAAQLIDRHEMIRAEQDAKNLESLLGAVLGQGDDILKALVHRAPGARDEEIAETLRTLVASDEHLKCCAERMADAVRADISNLRALIDCRLDDVEARQAEILDGVADVGGRVKKLQDGQYGLRRQQSALVDGQGRIRDGQRVIIDGQAATREEVQALRALIEQLIPFYRAAPPNNAQAARSCDTVHAPPRQGMLRFLDGAIYQLRATSVLMIGRDTCCTWQVLFMPRSPENDQRSQAISRQHVRLQYDGARFLAEDFSTGSTVCSGNQLQREEGVQLEDGAELTLAGELTLRLHFFPDTHGASSRPFRAAHTEPIRRAGALADPLTIGNMAPGWHRSVLIERVENRGEERCVWLLKRAYIGSDASRCEIFAWGAPERAAELLFVERGFALRALASGVRVGGSSLAVGQAPRVLAMGDEVQLPGGAEAVFLVRKAPEIALSGR